MTAERENIINIILGRRASGKSTAQANEFIPADLAAGKTVMVILTKENPVFDKFKGNPKVHILTIASVQEITILLKASYNCSYYFDDARGLFGLQMDTEVMRLIIHSRQMNCDLHFCYHSFKKTCLSLYDTCDCYTIFETKDTPQERKQFFSQEEIEEINLQRSQLKKYEHFVFVQ